MQVLSCCPASGQQKLIEDGWGNLKEDRDWVALGGRSYKQEMLRAAPDLSNPIRVD